MIKRLSVLLALMCCLVALWSAPAAAADPSGFIVTYQGNKIEVVRFKNLLPTYIFRYQGVLQNMPMEQIKSLTLKGGAVVLERRDGTTLKVTGSLLICAGNALEFVFKDSLSGKDSDGQLDPMLISLVQFN